jgi:hypothetical protein
MKRAPAVLLLASAVVWARDGTAVDLTRQQWNGNAICYSGYGLGQHPDREIVPSQAQVPEDLRILEQPRPEGEKP